MKESTNKTSARSQSATCKSTDKKSTPQRNSSASRGTASSRSTASGRVSRSNNPLGHNQYTKK